MRFNKDQAPTLAPDEGRMNALDITRLLGFEAAGKFDEAESEYRTLVLEQPQLVVGWLGMARIARMRSQWAVCLEWADQVLSRFPGQSDAFIERATSLEYLRRFDEADAAWSQLRRDYPAHPMGWLGSMRAARRSGEWEACVEHADEFLGRFSSRVDVLCEKASALERLGQLDAADETYAECCRAHPEAFLGWVGWARLAESRERWDAALHHWTEMQERFPANPEPTYGAIRAAYESGDFLQAAKGCRRLVSIGDSSIRAAIEVSTIRIAGGDDALPDLAKAFVPRPQVAPTGPPLLMVTGDSHVTAIAEAARSWQRTDLGLAVEPFQKFTAEDRKNMALVWQKELAVWSSAHRVFVTIQGNEHIVFGLAQHPNPYRTLHDEGKATDAPYISWRLLRASLRRNMQTTTATLRAIACFLGGRVVVLESPPPCPSAEYMSGRIGSSLELDVQRYGFASPASRLDLWKLRSDIVRAECRKMKVPFLPSPAQSKDADGFLVEAAWGDASHGNVVYGRWVLEQIERVAEGHSDELC